MVKPEAGGGEGGLSPLPLSPEHAQYYQTLFTVITGPSNTLFKVNVIFFLSKKIKFLSSSFIFDGLCM